MALENTEIKKLLGQIFDTFQEVEHPEERIRQKQEFVFHMTDWTSDLKKIAGLYQNPKKLGPDASKIVVAFLYHAIPHLNAAGRLLLDRIPDPFSKGVSHEDY